PRPRTFAQPSRTSAGSSSIPRNSCSATDRARVRIAAVRSPGPTVDAGRGFTGDVGLGPPGTLGAVELPCASRLLTGPPGSNDLGARASPRQAGNDARQRDATRSAGHGA